MKEFIVKSEKKMTALGAKLAKKISNGSVILLYGDLGAGKSVFARGIILSYKIEGNITSPTFTILNTYENNKVLVYHFDFYRIEDISEAYAIGADEMLANKNAIKIVEWPEKVSGLFLPPYIKINIEKLDDCTRKVIVEGVSL